MIEFVTNTAAYLMAPWRDASNPSATLASLTLAQADIVIIQQANGGTATTGAVTTSAPSPAAVVNGSGFISIPLTATDLNFVGRATVRVWPAAAIEQVFEVDVVADKRTPARAKEIEEDTSELQADWEDGGRLDLLLDDVPTTSELNARTLPTADYATSTALAVVDGVVDGIALILSGITSLANWLRALARLSTPDATALSEINDGGGTFDSATDSLQGNADAVGDVADLIGDGTITVISHQLPGQAIVLVRGDSYEDGNGRYLSWINETGAEWPDDLTGATINFTAILASETGDVATVDATKKIVATGTVVVAEAPNQEVRCELTPDDTDVVPGVYGYDVEAVLSTDEVHTLVTTEVPPSVLQRLTRNERDALKLIVLRQYSNVPPSP